MTHSEKIAALKIRSEVENGIKNFFLQKEFLEVRTPLLVHSPGMEAHIRPFKILGKTFTGYLPTSPEFAMKTLLCEGLKKIFQICPCFRDEPFSSIHLPEYTMLEWYQVTDDFESMYEMVENMFEHIVKICHNGKPFYYQNQKITLQKPWKRWNIKTLYSQLGISLETIDKKTFFKKAQQLHLHPPENASWEDLFFLIWTNCIEPLFPKDEFIFVYNYPHQLAANARCYTDEQGYSWAYRFEIYLGNLEIGNAFFELLDPVEQKNRFENEMQQRAYTYSNDPSFLPNPMPEKFLQAMTKGLPSSAGIAVGLDRLIMIMANVNDIRKTVWLEPYF